MKSLALLTLGLAAAATTVQADVLLTIDVSNPGGVTFTATTGTSDATASGPAVLGFTLLDFFPVFSSAQWQPSGGDVAVTGGTVNYIETDGPGPFAAGFNLTFTSLTDDSFNFTTGVQALSGSVTLNMFGMNLPSAGTVGGLFIGRQTNGNSLGAQIGTWEVVAASPVPEPASAAALVGLAAVGVAAMRRRQRQK